MKRLLLLVALCACNPKAPPADSASPASDTVSSDCQTDTGGGYPTWPGFGEAFFLGRCAACHAEAAPDRFGAPVGVTFDAEADIIRQQAAIRRTVLVDATMPPGGGILDDEVAELERFLDCLPDTADR